MKKQNYSSKVVSSLLNNSRWNFWKNDWSKRIIVEWNPKIKLEKFRQDVIDKLGVNFIYERALSNDETDFIATDSGLEKFKVLSPKPVL